MRVGRAIGAATRPRHLVVGGFVLQVERVNSDQLRREGWAQLEGAAEAQTALQEVRRDQAEARAAYHGTPDEERAARRAHDEEREAHRRRRTLEALLARPEGEVAWLQRCTAFVCAAVTAIGLVRDDAALPVVDSAVGPMMLLDDGQTVESVARDLRGEEEPLYLEAGRFVRERGEEDLDRNLVWVHRLTEVQRIAAGMAVMGLQATAVTAEVKPFRVGPGAVAGASPGGEVVREAPARDPAPRSGGPGAGDRVRGAGGRGGRAEGRGRGQ